MICLLRNKTSMVLTRLCSQKYGYRAICDPYKIHNFLCYYYAFCFGLGICAEMILKKQVTVLLILSLRFYFTEFTKKLIESQLSIQNVGSEGRVPCEVKIHQCTSHKVVFFGGTIQL